MTNENPPSAAPHEHKPSPFGVRLKAAREAMGLEPEEVATQLRLNKKIILMMERDRYAPDLPVIFIRGYIRAYGKLLQIPEHEIKKAIEPIKQKISSQDEPLKLIKPIPVTTGNPIMQTITYGIFLTILGLVGVWWYSHTPSNFPPSAESPLAAIPQLNTVATQTAAPVNAATIPPSPIQAAAAPKEAVTTVQIENKNIEVPGPRPEATSTPPQPMPSAARPSEEVNQAQNEAKEEVSAAYDDRSE